MPEMVTDLGELGYEIHAAKIKGIEPMFMQTIESFLSNGISLADMLTMMRESLENFENVAELEDALREASNLAQALDRNPDWTANRSEWFKTRYALPD